MSASSEASQAQTAGRGLQTRPVALFQPVNWLQKGWQDFSRQPGPSIAYGLLIMGLGFVVLMFATTHVYFMAAAISGFLLVGPIMATGLCELSRRRAQHESVSFDESLDALGRHRTALMHFAGILFGISVLWFVVSGLILETFLGSVTPDVSLTLWGDFLANLTLMQTLIYIVVGGLLAVAVFALSVASVPAIIDRDVTASEAMQESARAAAANIPAMLVWAGLIVVLTGIGFATFLLGMIVVFPLLGHATWYAYRDLIQ